MVLEAAILKVWQMNGGMGQAGWQKEAKLIGEIMCVTAEQGEEFLMKYYTNTTFGKSFV